MAKQRPSVHKRQREHQKRQREMKKAEKAALKRERKLNRDLPNSDSVTADTDLAPIEDSAGTEAVEVGRESVD